MFWTVCHCKSSEKRSYNAVKRIQRSQLRSRASNVHFHPPQPPTLNAATAPCQIVESACGGPLLCDTSMRTTITVIFRVPSASCGRPVNDQASGTSQHDLTSRQSHRRLHTSPTPSAACRRVRTSVGNIDEPTRWSRAYHMLAAAATGGGDEHLDMRRGGLKRGHGAAFGNNSPEKRGCTRHVTECKARNRPHPCHTVGARLAWVCPFNTRTWHRAQ